MVRQAVAAEERRGDELLRADHSRRSNQGARSLGAQPVRLPHVAHRGRRFRQRGDLVDDRIRAHPVERLEQRGAIQNVRDDLGDTQATRPNRAFA